MCIANEIFNCSAANVAINWMYRRISFAWLMLKWCDNVEWIPVAQDGVQWWFLAVADWTVDYVNLCSLRAWMSAREGLWFLELIIKQSIATGVDSAELSVRSPCEIPSLNKNYWIFSPKIVSSPRAFQGGYWIGCTRWRKRMDCTKFA